MKAVSDCFLIRLHQDDVKWAAAEYPELMARLISLRRLGQRKARDYKKAMAELNTSETMNSTVLDSECDFFRGTCGARI